MKPDPRFLKQPKSFWAYVRLISQQVGYTSRGSGRILAPDLPTVIKALNAIGLDAACIGRPSAGPTKLGQALTTYLAHRANVLNDAVEPCLMNAAQAATAFARVRTQTNSEQPVPMNKQKGAKK